MRAGPAGSRRSITPTGWKYGYGITTVSSQGDVTVDNSGLIDLAHNVRAGYGIQAFADAGDPPRSYSLSDDLMVVSDSPSHLAWAVDHLAQGAGSPFAAAIGDRYKRGAGWLIGVDAAPVIAKAAQSLDCGAHERGRARQKGADIADIDAVCVQREGLLGR